MLIYFQEKKFLCISCNKPYMNLYQLREHIQKGMCRDESRTCGICHKVFYDKHRMLRHLKIHENVREFKCDKCDKSFNQKRTLKEHKLTHSTSRQFECKICLKKFVQPNHLKVRNHQYTDFKQWEETYYLLCVLKLEIQMRNST